MMNFIYSWSLIFMGWIENINLYIMDSRKKKNTENLFDPFTLNINAIWNNVYWDSIPYIVTFSILCEFCKVIYSHCKFFFNLKRSFINKINFSHFLFVFKIVIFFLCRNMLPTGYYITEAPSFFLYIIIIIIYLHKIYILILWLLIFNTMSLFLSHTLVFCSSVDDTLNIYLCGMCSMEQKKICKWIVETAGCWNIFCTNEFAVFSNVN